MNKRFFLMVLWCVFFLQLNASVKMIGSIENLTGLKIGCHPNFSIIVELPKDINILKVEQSEQSLSKWTVDHDLNLLWAQPENLESPDCTIKIKTDVYKDIVLRLMVEKDSKKLIHTFVLKKGVFERVDNLEETANIDNDNLPESKIKKVENEYDNPGNSLKTLKKNIKGTTGPGKTQKIDKSKSDIGDLNNSDKNISSFKLESYLSLSGGTQSFQNSSFALEGEIIVAGKNESGIFFQAAGKTIINDMLKQYGFSVGAGFEPGKLGFFLFGDLLLHKFGEEFNSTTHFQLRPSIRYRLSDKVHLAGFYALPLGVWQYSGVEVPGEYGFGFYNKSLGHAGLDLSVFLSNMFLDIRALVVEGSAFGIDLKAGYEIIRKLFVTINYIYQTSGDYEYLDGISNTSRIGIGVTFNMRNFENRAKKKIIFRPDYPLVVVDKRELDEDISVEKPEISLLGTPTTGYAPLDVSFTAIHRGFKGTDVEITWYFNTTYSTTSNNKDSGFTYTTPGSYECYVEGKDEFGNYAKSNTVIITVLDVTSEEGEYTITSSVTEGTGTIDPEGTTIVKFDKDQKYTMIPEDGWYIAGVNVDGKSVGNVTEYTFKKVAENHTISVKFTEEEPETYVVNASSGPGGSISPNGSITVTQGDSIEFTMTADDGYELDTLKVDGSNLTVSGDTFTLTNIQKDQAVAVTWKLKTYTVTGTVRNSQYGTISPVTSEVEHGSNAVITFTPEDSNKETIRYWVNGTQTTAKGSTGITISNVTSNQSVEVEFDWIYYDITVILTELGDYSCSATLDPGAGTFSARKGSKQTLNCTPHSPESYLKRLYVNGNQKAVTQSYVLNNLDRDYVIEFQIERESIPVGLDCAVTGCWTGRITTSYGDIQNGGGSNDFNVPYGYSITFTFVMPSTKPDDVDHWVLTTENQNQIPLPNQYTINNVNQPGMRIHVKCVMENGDIIE